MTSDKLIDVFQFYRYQLADRMRIYGIQLPDYDRLGVEYDRIELLSHVAYMCSEAIKHVQAGSIEKGMRWLGFVQGILYAMGVYTLDELKNHSRPDIQLEYGCKGDGLILDHIVGSQLNEVDILPCPGCPNCQPLILEQKASGFVVGKSYDCKKCHRRHPPGPCENFRWAPLTESFSEEEGG